MPQAQLGISSPARFTLQLAGEERAILSEGKSQNGGKLSSGNGFGCLDFRLSLEAFGSKEVEEDVSKSP